MNINNLKKVSSLLKKFYLTDCPSSNEDADCWIDSLKIDFWDDNDWLYEIKVGVYNGKEANKYFDIFLPLSFEEASEEALAGFLYGRVLKGLEGYEGC